MKEREEQCYTPMEIIDIFRRSLLSWKDDLEITVEDIKSHAPKGANGEYEENSYLRVKQAQLQIVKDIDFHFNNLIEEMGENNNEENID